MWDMISMNDSMLDDGDDDFECMNLKSIENRKITLKVDFHS